MNDRHPRRAKDREVMASAFLGVVGNADDLADSGRVAAPAALPAPPEAPKPTINDPLGEPLDIQAVAKLIGCSAWTVRQKYVPAGLPHLRSGPNGKLLFYKNQVIRWLLRQQQKGGITL